MGDMKWAYADIKVVCCKMHMFTTYVSNNNA